MQIYLKVSVPVIKTIITSYGLFELIENEEGIIFISSKLNKWLEPYYTKVEKLSRAGKISALKKKKEQEKQLKELSQLDSSQHMLNTCATINKLINKSINKNVDNESEFWREWNETEIKKGMRISKLEDLNLANRDNQVKIQSY